MMACPFLRATCLVAAFSVLTLSEDVSNDLRRRMQFSTTTSGPPTKPPSMPPTPLGSSIYKDDTNPFVFVDFGTHISWASAGTFCEEQLGTRLASVDRQNQLRISELEQIDLMMATCQGEGDPNVYNNGHPDCWIGLKYSPQTTLFEWENGQSLDPPTNPNGASQTGWRPGKNTPTAFTFLSGETTFCVAIAKIPGHDVAFWDNVDCVFFAPTFPVHAVLCENPDYIWTPTQSPTASPTISPSAAPTANPTGSETYHWIAGGASNKNLVSQCVADTSFQDIVVSCCTLDGSSGVRPDCKAKSKTYEEAVQVCADHGHRLCTKDEMEGDLTKNKGCFFNRNHNWVSDECTSADAGMFTLNIGTDAAKMTYESALDERFYFGFFILTSLK